MFRQSFKENNMRTKYLAGIIAALAVAGTALAYTMNNSVSKATFSPTTTAETNPVETDNCCLTGDCCCPGQGLCCDSAAKAQANDSGIKYVKKSGAGCCVTGDCCCPGQGLCCAVDEKNGDGKSCCQSKAKKDGTTK
jgi:hypothetical protein